jgi:hypothetical protein
VPKVTDKEGIKMKHTLLLVVLGILAGVVPAQGQYVYLDVNGDGLNFDREAMIGNAVPSDLLSAADTAVDVYFVTDKMADGSDATCTSAEPFTIVTYEAVLRYTGSGTVTFHSWTDNLGFMIPMITAGDGTIATSGNDVWFGRGSGPAGLPPGLYKVGTLNITVTGQPMLIFGMNSTISGNAQTAFASQCDGALFDGTIRLGPISELGITADFAESFGAAYVNPIVSTTWGKIKERYR